MQTVFRVDIPKRPDQEEEKPFVPRRVHHKSRAGCLACKKRRIKCDEGRPTRSECEKTTSDCIYTSTNKSSPKTLFIDERTPSPEPSADMYSMSVNMLETDLDDLLDITSNLDISAGPTSSVRILKHFSSFTSLTLGSSTCRAVMHSFVTQKAWDYSYLMHMVLVVYSAHLKRLHSDASQLRLHQHFSCAEAAHWQTGLQLYQEALENQKPDFDATVASTLLTIIFTFSLDDDIPQDSYIGEDGERLRHAINPLAATGGFRALRDIFGQSMNMSVWRIVLQGSDDNMGTFSDATRPGIGGLPIAFVKLCGLDSKSTNENNE